MWGISSRINSLIYLCYNLCFILVIQTLCQCVGQCVQDCTPWPPLNSTWWRRSYTGKSETLSSQGILVLIERRSLLSFFGCSFIGVTYLFWQTQTIQVFTEASLQDPRVISGTWKRFQLQPDTEQACTMWDWMCHLIPTLRVPLPSSCNAHTSVTSPS